MYLTHPVPHRPLTSVRFCPFQDILTVGHTAGLSSILIPGAGEPNFDSAEADPFENKQARREREVKGLLDKIQPDMIALDPEFVGALAPEPKLTTAVDDKTEVPFARLPRLERLRVSGRADETEEGAEGAVAEGSGDEEPAARMSKAEKEKKKMRGKNKSLKRYLRKQRKNVIDPKAVSIFNGIALILALTVEGVNRSRCARSSQNRGRRERRQSLFLAARWSHGNLLHWIVSGDRPRSSSIAHTFCLRTIVTAYPISRQPGYVRKLSCELLSYGVPIPTYHVHCMSWSLLLTYDGAAVDKNHLPF